MVVIPKQISLNATRCLMQALRTCFAWRGPGFRFVGAFFHFLSDGEVSKILKDV